MEVERTVSSPATNAKLILAAAEGRLWDVRNALTDGADVNAKTTKGLTALIAASFSGHTEVVKLLLVKGADLNVRRSDDGVTALWLASQNGHTEVVRLLLDRGADGCIKSTNFGATALIQAALQGHTEIVKLLLDKGANADVKTVDGSTAFFMASQNGHTEVVRLLLDKGADVNAKRTTDGATALMIASQKGHTEVVRLLLDKGSDVNAKNSNCATALFVASQKGHTEVVRLLLDKSADVNVKRTEDGSTALWLASQQGHVKVVKLLLDKGADVNAKRTTEGATALMIASQKGHTEIVKLIKLHTCAVQQTEGEPPIQPSWRTTSPAEFVPRAAEGPAYCRIPLTEIPDIAKRLSKELMVRGVPSSEMTDLFSNSLLAVCPECRQYCAGDLMLSLAVYSAVGAGNITFMTNEVGGGPKQRLLGGQCGTSSCSNHEFYHLFWCPDLHPEMLQYLGADFDISLDPHTQVKRSHVWRPQSTPQTPRQAAGEVDHDPKLIEAANEKLILAAREGNLADVQTALTDGADVNLKTTNGVTALHVASAEGHTEVVRLLLDKGADRKAKDIDADTALMYALRRDQKEVVKLLQSLVNKPLPNAMSHTVRKDPGISDQDAKLLRAADEGNFADLQTALTDGADVNAMGTSEWCIGYPPRYVTALHVASNQGYTEIVKLLLDKGADVNVKDARYNKTPLCEASRSGRTKIVKLLLDKGADVNVKDAGGHTPLLHATLYGHTDVVKLLVDKGADLNITAVFYSNWRGTALRAARFNGRTDIVRILERAGAKE